MNFKNLLTNIFKKKEAAVEIVETAEVEEVIEEVAKPIEKPKWGGIKSEKEWKFSEQEKQMVVSWYAMGLSSYEVVEKAKEELNIDISPFQVRVYSHTEKWQPLIKKVREAHMQDLASIGGSHKKVRLQRHEKIYDKAIGKNKYDLALKATEAQRKEMEEGNVTLTLNQFNVLSDDELEFKKNEVMNRIKLLANKGVIDVISTDKREATGA